MTAGARVTPGGLRRRGLLVGGAERPGGGEPLYPVNPASGEVIAEVQAADERDADDAVAVAADAFAAGVWRDRTIQHRARVLWRLAGILEGCLGELTELETLNNGRPVTETRAQIGRLGEWYRYNASLLLADTGRVTPMPGPYHSYTSR
ncbi:MAG: aldehyde dehydrogenase family protein, partial [Nocardiopsaceae bacterium]|nr:aldehyde dehydrogenase family protein [Nocardiopsaceae bacterium]